MVELRLLHVPSVGGFRGLFFGRFAPGTGCVIGPTFGGTFDPVFRFVALVAWIFLICTLGLPPVPDCFAITHCPSVAGLR